MSFLKCKANLVGSFVLIVYFTATMANADTGPRSLFAGKQGLFSPQTKNNSPFTCKYSPPAWNGSMSAERISTIDKQERSKIAKIFGEFWGGILGNALGGLLGASIELASENHGSGIVLFGGSALGSALGVYLAGHSDREGGKFSMTLLGSVLGELAAFGLLRSSDDGISLIPLLLFPVIGAVVGYNVSLTSRSLSRGNAILNLNEGKLALGIPLIKIRRMQAKDERTEPAYGFHVRFFSVGL